MEKLIEKENSIFEILQRFLDDGLNFIVIGGYAVSAYKHRFSVDADIVIRPEDRERFEKILIKEKFSKTRERDLENIYSSKFMRYEKSQPLKTAFSSFFHCSIIFWFFILSH
jgi:hypothetical protein